MTIAVMFDFNGVLVDDEDVHFEAFRRTLAVLGVTISHDVYRRFLGYDDRRTLVALLEHHRRGDFDDRALARAVDDKQAAYAQLAGLHPRLGFGARALVQRPARRRRPPGDRVGRAAGRDRRRPRRLRAARQLRGRRGGGGRHPGEARSRVLSAGAGAAGGGGGRAARRDRDRGRARGLARGARRGRPLHRPGHDLSRVGARRRGRDRVVARRDRRRAAPTRARSRRCRSCSRPGPCACRRR